MSLIDDHALTCLSQESPAEPAMATAPTIRKRKSSSDLGKVHNAFSVMKKASAALAPSHRQWVLFVNRDEPMRLKWCVEKKGTNNSIGGLWTRDVILKKDSLCVVNLQHVHDPGAPGMQPHAATFLPLHGLSISRLKSALQKNVRLSRPVAAVRVAWALIRTAEPPGGGASGLTELLRRLPIIAIEDSLPSPLFPQLVWIMLAHTHGLPLLSGHINLVLAATLQMAASNHCEDCRSPSSMVPPPLTLAQATADAEVAATFLAAGDSAREKSCNDASLCADLAAALLVRLAYGGMTGDMAMLRTAATVWHRRSQESGAARTAWARRLRAAAEPNAAVATVVSEALMCSFVSGRSRNTTTISSSSSSGSSSTSGCLDGGIDDLRAAMRGDDGLRWQDIPLSGIDFHCSNVLDAALAHAPTVAELRRLLVAERLEGGREEVVVASDAMMSEAEDVEGLAKRAMWMCSSGLSAKQEWRTDGELQIGPRELIAAVTAGRRAAEASRAAQADAEVEGDGKSGGGTASWIAEADAAGAVLASSAEKESKVRLEVQAWRALAPECRRFECREVRRILEAEARQRGEFKRIFGVAPWTLLQPPTATMQSMEGAHSNRRLSLLHQLPFHHDSGASSGPAESYVLEPHPLLEGLYLGRNFVSDAEEAALLFWADRAHWQPAYAAAQQGAPTDSATRSGARTAAWEPSRWNSPGAGNEGKAWGAVTRAGGTGRLVVPRFDPLPPPLAALAHRIGQLATAVIAEPAHKAFTSSKAESSGNTVTTPNVTRFGIDQSLMAHLEGGLWRPNQANAISYTKARGHFLGSHCDDRQLSGPVLCTLSLGCDAYMTYQLDSQKKKPQRSPSTMDGSAARAETSEAVHRMFLPRRSIQIQTGKVRFDYQHGIANDDIGGTRRVSITFRKEKSGKA